MHAYRVVVAMDGESRLKGYADRLDPRAPWFRLREVDAAGETVAIREVDLESVHAVFFVQDLALDRSHRRTGAGNGLLAGPGERVRVTFAWGETLEGIALTREPADPWLDLVPLPGSSRSPNLERILVAKRSIARLEVLEEDPAAPDADDDPPAARARAASE